MNPGRETPRNLNRSSAAVAAALGIVVLGVPAAPAGVARARPGGVDTAARAALSNVYVDSGTEAAGAPDITSVEVADDDGRLSVKLSFAGGTVLQPSYLVVVGLDVDRDRRTGGPMGMDYALSATTSGAELGVWFSSSWTGSGYAPIRDGATMSVGDGPSLTLETTVGRLGALMERRHPRLRFVAVAIADTEQSEDSWVSDVAGPWTYSVQIPSRLVISTVVLASRPGGALSARMRATLVRGDYRELVDTAEVTARAFVGQRRLRLVRSGSSRGWHGATWRLPRWAQGRTVRGSLTISVAGARVMRTFRGVVD